MVDREITILKNEKSTYIEGLPFLGYSWKFVRFIHKNKNRQFDICNAHILIDYIISICIYEFFPHPSIHLVTAFSKNFAGIDCKTTPYSIYLTFSYHINLIYLIGYTVVKISFIFLTSLGGFNLFFLIRSPVLEELMEFCVFEELGVYF